MGRIKFGHFSLGPVIGTLLVGLGLGVSLHPEIPDVLRWAFFDLFLFSIGYSVGPQFFSSLKKSAIPQIIITLCVNVSGLAMAVLVCYLFRFDTGISAGILSGSLTQSAAIGTSLSAIRELPLPAAELDLLSTHVPLADAMTYVFGDLGLILMLIVILPALFKVDLKKESQILEEQLKKGAIGGGKDFFQATKMETLRAYQITNPEFVGKSISEVEQQFVASRIFVTKVLRDGVLQQVSPGFRFAQNDIISIAGWRSGFMNGIDTVGREVANTDVLKVELSERKVIVTKKEVVGKTLGEIAEEEHGLLLKKITRGPVELEIGPNLDVQRGDVYYLLGATADLDWATRKLGFTQKDVNKSDLSFMGICISIGIFMGMLAINWQGVPLGLGASGSILLVGLTAGWLQNRFPVTGYIPESAQQLMIDLGLIVFIAIVGLNAGPHAIQAIKAGGVDLVFKILIAGAIITLTGPLVGFLVAKYILKQNGAMALAAIAGAQTTTPAINAIQDASGSKVLATAFTMPYAMGNILLTLWGPVMVAISRLWQ
jgi:putative transport protein